VSEPLTPVTLTVYVPVGVEDGVRTVTVARPGVGVATGSTVAVDPAGRPSTARSTGPEKPPIDPTEMLLLKTSPGAPETVDGEAEREKSGTELN
jgi:hypothetical protein